ncbi:hypothetical protein [Psychrobacter sp. HII-4]|uniref:hypothetical protein n=1 Tax=Psychrobacter sp. HII-4 TaxID=1569264 RepID=UPI00191B1ECC|nr:hypothetical protein [Psychrobacter sp. HII-4]
MSSYTPKDKWHPTIRQFDINEIVEGGSTGLDNIPHQQLADNLLHLEKRIAAIEEGSGSTPPDTGGGDTGGQPTDPNPTDPNALPAGDWIVTKTSSEPDWQGAARHFEIKHSSGESIPDVTVRARQRVSSTGQLSGYSKYERTFTLPVETWWVPEYSVAHYDQILIEITHPSMSEPIVKTLSGISELTPWSINTTSPTPFEIGQTPTFTATHSNMKGRQVPWIIEDVQKSGTEGDQITEVNRGTGTVNSSGVLIMQSATLPATTLSSATEHVIRVRLLDGSNNSKEFPIN